MTEMKAFAEQIAGTMNMEENGSKKFRIWEKRKINGTVSFGIFSAGNGGGASPVVYLEPFYDAYRNGMPLEEITGQIRKGLDGGESPDPEAVRILERFETAAGRLVFRLVNADMNRELLDQVPHVRILDLAVGWEKGTGESLRQWSPGRRQTGGESRRKGSGSWLLSMQRGRCRQCFGGSGPCWKKRWREKAERCPERARRDLPGRISCMS